MESYNATEPVPLKWKTPSVTAIYALFVTAFVIIFMVALALDSEETRRLLLKSVTRVAAPLAAALVAWLGINHTVLNARRLESLKEWHADLRWACKMCLSEENKEANLGVAILDSIDDHPDLSKPEQELIDAALTSILATLQESAKEGQQL
ncbi:hypothetical protein [Corynebacterium lubricantis]|uniref:hypothetical protein n=1 Tax=Corynebacterium lubricantis TaxID=541095 RepID=UPI0012EA1872|nr:hypothetical protein [Corynebacterium lubricantis]